MFSFTKKSWIVALFAIGSLGLTACSNPSSTTNADYDNSGKGSQIVHSRLSLTDQATVLNRLSQRQQEWKGTRYRLGGNSKKGIDCSGFAQLTFKELFGIALPRTTADQAKVGTKVSKENLQAGDLVFFKTGRGPNGKHVGIYLKNGQFLHASTKGGIIFSSLTSPYWTKTYWQARRL